MGGFHEQHSATKTCFSWTWWHLRRVGGLGLSAAPCHCRLDVTPACMAEVYGAGRPRRCGKYPCPPRNRARAANCISHHVSRNGGRHLHHDWLSHPSVCIVALDEMLVITFKVQMANGWGFSVQGGGAEFTVMWALLFLIILIRGGGHYSVDRAIGREI